MQMAKLSTQIIMAWPWLKPLKIHLNGKSYYSWSITEIDGGFSVYLLSFQTFFQRIMIFAHIQPQTSMFTRFSGIFRIQIALFYIECGGRVGCAELNYTGWRCAF